MRRPRSNSKPGVSKAALRAEAEAQMAAYLARGQSVQVGPAVVVEKMVCETCGHIATVGHTPGDDLRCPQCKASLQMR
jgi:hypothetical protein